MLSVPITNALGQLYVDTLIASPTDGQVLTYETASGKWKNKTASSGLTVGTTAIASGTNTRVLYDNSGVVGEYPITGTGNVVMSASPTVTGTLTAAAATFSGAVTITGTGAADFAVGPNGNTNPVLRVVDNTASQADGLSITGLAAGSGVTLTALSSGSNAPITLTPKGTGQVLMPVGSSAAPGISFTGTTNTGMRLASGGVMLVAGGTDIAWFRASSLTEMQLSTNVLTWGSSFGGGDLTLSRVTGKVLQVGDSGANSNGWIVSAATGRVTGDVTNATATPAAITGAVFSAIAGRKYVGYFLVPANNSTAAEGLAYTIGGTATWTSVGFGFIGTPIGATIGTAYSTTPATPITVTTATTGDIMYMIPFTGVCNAAGTCQLQGAEVSHTLGTATFRAGAFFEINNSST